MTRKLQGFYSCKVKDINNQVLAETGCYITVPDELHDFTLTKEESKLTSFNKLPFFVNELSTSITLKEGDNLCLFCRLNADCEPKPKIMWFKDGQQLNQGKFFDLISNPQTGECRLLADNCEKMKFEGLYTCVAALPGSKTDFIAKTSCHVKIYSYKEILEVESRLDDGRSSITRGIPPMFLQSLKDTIVEEGDDLELKCQIMGAPLPDVVCYITKDITDKTSFKKIRQDLISYNCETGICRVVLKNISYYSNDGFYILKATNEAGSLTTACQVRVKLKSYPVLNLDSEIEPKFTTHLPQEVKVMDGQEICLTCVCQAKPEPNIEWFKKLFDQDEFVPVHFTSDIKPGFDATTGKCTLKISDTYPQDAGVYKCVASNLYGQDETTSHLFVEAYEYEPDSEEGSFSVDLTESDGTITPTSRKFETYSEYESDSNQLEHREFKQSQSLTGSEYFTANSGFTTDSAASSSIWK